MSDKTTEERAREYLKENGIGKLLFDGLHSYDSLKWLTDFATQEVERATKELKSCPCIHLDEACHANCTCVNSFSSRGCDNCCTYGSEEQQKQSAIKLQSLKQENERLKKEFNFKNQPIINNNKCTCTDKATKHFLSNWCEICKAHIC